MNVKVRKAILSVLAKGNCRRVHLKYMYDLFLEGVDSELDKMIEDKLIIDDGKILRITHLGKVLARLL